MGECLLEILIVGDIYRFMEIAGCAVSVAPKLYDFVLFIVKCLSLPLHKDL